MNHIDIITFIYFHFTYFLYRPNATEILMVPHESNEPEVIIIIITVQFWCYILYSIKMEMDGDEERLLPRVISVISVNRENGGSRMSLNSRKGGKKGGLLGSLSKKLSRLDILLYFKYKYVHLK